MDTLQGIEILDAIAEAEELASELVAQGAIPASQPRDAFHIGIGAVHGVQNLVTWNFKHIANPMVQKKIASVCRNKGFESPVICTPEQLLEADNGSNAI